MPRPRTASPQHTPAAMRCDGMFTHHAHTTGCSVGMWEACSCSCQSHACGCSWADGSHEFGVCVAHLCWLPQLPPNLATGAKKPPWAAQATATIGTRICRTPARQSQLHGAHCQKCVNHQSGQQQRSKRELGGSGCFQNSVMGGWDGGYPFAGSAQGQYLLVPRLRSRHRRFFCRNRGSVLLASLCRDHLQATQQLDNG